MSILTADDQAVRLAVYAAFAEQGTAPSRDEVTRATGLGLDAVAASYERLAAAHVLVLWPRSGEILMAMPFSAVPTAFRVRSAECEWWANCAWDAFGIAAATRRDVEIETICPDCGERLGCAVRGGRLVPGERAADAVTHFLVPRARWWENIGYT
jgi:hypothetical protein